MVEFIMGLKEFKLPREAAEIVNIASASSLSFSKAVQLMDLGVAPENVAALMDKVMENVAAQGATADSSAMSATR